jgi:hypothetical protein
MGEFSEKISVLNDSEINEIWHKITNYQSVYIDDFLTELNARGLREDFVHKLTDNTLVSIGIKLSEIVNSANVEFVNSIIEKRGIKDLKPNSNNQKRKFNFAIPAGGLGLLIIVLFKLFARTTGENLRQEQNRIENNIEQTFENNCVEISKKLFEKDGALRIELDQIKILNEKNNAEVFHFSKSEKEEKINNLIQNMKVNCIMGIDEVLYRKFNKGLPEYVKESIIHQYHSELNSIFFK